MNYSEFDHECMRLALELAAQGRGRVEPNPLVGCVLARDGQVLARGWHRQFGGPHAEADALSQVSDRSLLVGATAYSTLEPCCHYGKTPPCTDALLSAGVRRVVAALRDPFPQVDGGGLAQLAAAGVQVEVGLLEAESRELNAPYLMLIEQARPWTIAKWAMTLDGKTATTCGDSQWISNESSRAVVHELRGRMDAIVAGRGTAERDDPLLTARPPGPRTATRIVLDSHASLSPASQLARTARETPVLVAAGPQADPANVAALQSSGCEVWQDAALDPFARLANLWRELGRRRFTNILVEGGSQLLGSLFDAQLVDEVHVFMAPKLIGGQQARSPVGGFGLERMAAARQLIAPVIEELDGDVYIRGRLARP
jgi:diaminohydroxyphosphoribosylaminopyrimidine deaminase/5-amino-6-(5-phosphoribosylamino)uracil reductase